MRRYDAPNADRVSGTMGLLIDFAVAKTNKYASRESGDTVEIVERPTGGLSAVLCDGQGTGRAAKSLSLLVTAKAVALLKDGVRDGAVARAVHDSLFAFRHGQISATLDILSVDLRAGSVIVARNAETPLLARQDGIWSLVPSEADPIGRYPMTKPAMVAFPATSGLRLALVSDGVSGAGARSERGPLDLVATAARLDGRSAQSLADGLLEAAIARDDGRPRDDMTVVALTLDDHDDAMLIRRMQVSMPASIPVRRDLNASTSDERSR
jgi:serine phosphatase RsbU (regulator of sigma subunit)